MASETPSARTGARRGPAARPPVTPPSAGLLLREQSVLFELSALCAASPLLRFVGRGDRHPVLVMPGFAASDTSTLVLRSLIRSWGFYAHGWKLGPNVGPTPDVLEGIGRRLDMLHQRHGAKVSIVGWSLGGLFARELARRSPDKVRQVITLGSPIQMTWEDRSNASGLADLLQPSFDMAFHRGADFELGPLPVPSTAIYTRTDGIVRWQICMDIADESHDNVEVKSSHIGLGYNPTALFVVADRLNQREGNWKPFRAPFGTGAFFPKAQTFEPDHPHRDHSHDHRLFGRRAS